LFDRAELLQRLERMMNGKYIDDRELTCLHLVVAIGARCHSDRTTYHSCERVYFARAQKQMTLQLLEDSSLHAVKTFLLLAFYMLCISRRNAAYMYLGVAARAAHVLGLHHEESHAQVRDESVLRYAHLSCQLITRS
jgi:hypothetical protein